MMKYRELGRTGLKVSAIGLGTAQLGSSDTGYAASIVRKALDLGVTYFDTARMYRDSEIKVGLGLKGRRDEVVVTTKTVAQTKDGAWQQLRESLERLQMDYVDMCYLHALWEGEDMETRLGPGGALEALVEAKEQGLVHHIGCSSHISGTLVEAIGRFDFEVILVPMNIVEREPLEALIPLCQEKGVGVTIMKPVATGLLPATLALKWVLSQPIATAVPGATTMEEIEEDALVGHLDDLSFTPDEERRVDALAEELEHVRCRICRRCEPCPVEIPIASTLGTDVMYDHYRTMGREAFEAFNWSANAIEIDIEKRTKLLEGIRACDDCGLCEERCSYGLPIVQMLRDMVPTMEDMMRVWGRFVRA